MQCSVEFSLFDPDGYAITVSQWKGSDIRAVPDVGDRKEGSAELADPSVVPGAPTDYCGPAAFTSSEA